MVADDLAPETLAVIVSAAFSSPIVTFSDADLPTT